MKYALIAASVTLFTAGNVRAENEFHLNNEFSLNYNEVSGPGKTKRTPT